MNQLHEDATDMEATEGLRIVLEGELNRYLDSSRRIVKVERRPFVYSTSFAIEELDVSFHDGTRLPVLLKKLSRAQMLDVARRTKPAFLFNPKREIEMYRAILARHCLGTPTYYGSLVDEQVGRFWLFLEKVPAIRLHKFEFNTWPHPQVCRWLAEMHLRFEVEVENPVCAQHLLQHDSDFYWRWLHRARAIVYDSLGSDSADGREEIDWLGDRYPRVVEKLLSLPTTVIHGEFYGQNILVQEQTDGFRVCPVDWEFAAVGPGLIDLAALTSGDWDEQQMDAMAMAYYSVLASHSDRVPPVDEFLNSLACCQLHLAILWVGWTKEWYPPLDGKRDWLKEAVRLAKKVVL